MSMETQHRPIRPTAEPPLRGIEAQRIFRRLAAHTDAFQVIERALAVSYELHLGAAARDFVTDSLRALAACPTEAKVDEVCAAARDRFATAGYDKLSRYKAGALRRTLAVTRLDTCTGHVVDVGAADNRLGECLLQSNPQCERVTGLDIRRDRALRTSDRLDFALQSSDTDLPLPDASADVLVFRYSLHHMTPSAQQRLLHAARRVLRPGGEILVVEDSFDDRQPPLADNAATRAFGHLGEESKYAALALLDASSCLTTYEQMPFAFSFRSGVEWEHLLFEIGFQHVRTEYWGFAMFSLYAAPMLIIKASV
jgi:ubiquinone/menaquinone biosynthesis C-methylase UbiE